MKNLEKKAYYDDGKWYCPREKLDTDVKPKITKSIEPKKAEAKPKITKRRSSKSLLKSEGPKKPEEPEESQPKI